MAAKGKEPAQVEVTPEEAVIIFTALVDESVEQNARCATARFIEPGVVELSRLGDDQIYKSFLVKCPAKLLLEPATAD